MTHSASHIILSITETVEVKGTKLKAPTYAWGLGLLALGFLVGRFL